MNRDQVLAELKRNRAEFDARVAAVPAEAFDVPAPGAPHSPKQIVAHVSAYESLIVERLRAARLGEMTQFDRDRVGWEAFNERIWHETAEQPADIVLANSARNFLSLLEEVAALGNGELQAREGVSAGVDPAWLDGRQLWEAIALDGFEHYPMHFAQLDAAAAQ